MINNINKNISVWRGEKTPPTEYHVWIKSNGSVLINKDGTWFTLISESTNDSVNVCNLSNVGYQPTLATAILTVSAYLGTKVFHVGYKLRYNEAPVGYDPIWKEYILTGSNWYRSDNWKLVFTTDLMNNEEIIKSGHLPSYVDDVLEYSTIDEFPTKGESGKIYLDTSTNKSYRWSGTLYVLIALTDIVTSESDGLMSSEMYNKLEKTASDLDIHDRQNLVDFAEIRLSLDQKVSKIVDSEGNIISENVSIATIPDGTSDTRGLLTPAIYKLVEDNKKMSEYLDNNKVEEIRNFLGTPFPKVGSIVTIPNATSLSAGLMTSDDKIKLDSIESEFVKDLGLVASTDKGDLLAAKSEIAGNVKISFIRYRTAGVRAERVTTIFLWRNGVNETALLKFVDKALWRRNVIGATGVEGATTSTTPWERTGAHYLGYDAASRTLQLKDYNLTVFRTVLLPLALNEADNVVDGLISSEDIASIITKAEFNRWTGEIYLKNKANNQVTSLVIPPATKDGMGLMSENDVIEMGTLTEHRINRNNPHQVTKAQVGLGDVTNDAQVKRSEMGVANGVALLNSEGKISSSYLPSYVSAVITADSYSALPTTGEEDKIYVTKDTNLTYRWSGTAYVEISPSIALGETSTTAYAGDRGKYLFDKVTDLSNRVGNGWVDTENGFVKIGTGSDSVSIVPGATIHASIEGDSSGVFTISSSTELTYLGYGANIGKGSKLGLNISATVESVRDPNGVLKSALVLKDTTDDLCLKVLCRDNNELKLSASTNTSDTKGWVDLARLNKISTMIDVEGDRGVVFYPDRLSNYSNDTKIVVGTNTTIGSNVTIGSYSGIGEGIKIAEHGKSNAWIIGTAISLGGTNKDTAYIGKGALISNYVKVSASIEDNGTGYVLLGDGTTKIKKGVTIDGNSGSSELRVHEYTRNDLDSWIIGTNPTPNTTGVQLGKGIIILGTSQLNLPILIKAQNRNNATALIGADFSAYSGVTLGSYSSLGNLAKLGDNVEIILGAFGLTIVSNDYGMTIGTKVSIGNNVSLGNNVIISDDVSISTSVSVSNTGDEVSVGDVTISTGIRITKNASATTILNGNDSSTAGGKLQFGTGNIIWSGAEIGTGVHITENLTFDSTSYKLGGTNLTTIGKNLNISGNVDLVDVLLKPSEGAAGKIRIQDTIGNANWLTLEGRNNILGGNFYGGSMSTIWGGVEIGSGINVTSGDNTINITDGSNQITSYGNVELGTNVHLGTSLMVDSADSKFYYEIGDSATVSTIGANVKLMASLGTASSSYILNDPYVSLSTIRGGVNITASLKTDSNGGYILSDPSMSPSTIGSNVIIGSDVEIGEGISLKDDNKAVLPILILTTVSGSTVKMGNNFNAYPGATLGTGADIGADVNIGANVSMGYGASIGLQVDISDDVAVGTSVVATTSGDSVEIGNDITIATGISITKNTAATTILNNNASSKGGKLTFGTGNIIWDGVEIGTGVHITEDLTADSTSYKLGETNLVIIGKNVKLEASLGIADNSYTLDDPDINIRISTIGLATVIYSEVTIGTGIQIQDSPAGGLQIYSPSLGRWITIS